MMVEINNPESGVIYILRNSIVSDELDARVVKYIPSFVGAP